MKIRAIIPNNELTNASSWWRIIRPLSMLRTMGHDATWHAFDDPVSFDMRGALVIVHRIIPADPDTYIKRLRKQGAAKIVYSIDDLTTDPDALREYLVNSGGLTTYAIDNMIERVSNEVKTINLCDYLLVSTTGLWDLIRQDIKPSIYCLKNAIDERWFVDSLSITPEYIGNGDKVYIGYASGRRPDSDLEDMAKAWGVIGNNFPNVRFVVAGWQPDIIDRHINLDQKIRIPWVPLDVWPKSMQVDIGCCPLADTTYNRGKSPIKYYEYSLAGAAVVASRLGNVYEDEIVHRVDGCLVANLDEWIWYLTHLVSSKSVRKTMQESAYYDIHNYRSLEASINNWEDSFQEMLG